MITELVVEGRPLELVVSGGGSELVVIGGRKGDAGAQGPQGDQGDPGQDLTARNVVLIDHTDTPYSPTVPEIVAVDASTAAVTVTLPEAATLGQPSPPIDVKALATDAGPVTITTSGADLIDGAATSVTLTAGEFRTLQPYSAGWLLI